MICAAEASPGHWTPSCSPSAMTPLSTANCFLVCCRRNYNRTSVLNEWFASMRHNVSFIPQDLSLFKFISLVCLHVGYARDVACGLAYLAAHNYVHRFVYGLEYLVKRSVIQRQTDRQTDRQAGRQQANRCRQKPDRIMG